jgi:hypothetical protein
VKLGELGRAGEGSEKMQKPMAAAIFVITAQVLAIDYDTELPTTKM